MIYHFYHFLHSQTKSSATLSLMVYFSLVSHQLTSDDNLKLFTLYYFYHANNQHPDDDYSDN